MSCAPGNDDSLDDEPFDPASLSPETIRAVLRRATTARPALKPAGPSCAATGLTTPSSKGISPTSSAPTVGAPRLSGTNTAAARGRPFPSAGGLGPSTSPDLASSRSRGPSWRSPLRAMPCKGGCSEPERPASRD
jgi:hypothetical protein